MKLDYFFFFFKITNCSSKWKLSTSCRRVTGTRVPPESFESRAQKITARYPKIKFYRELIIMNGGNIRLRMTLKLNVGCLCLASEMNGGNIRLRMTLKLNVGCLCLASEMNGGNIRLRMTLKINVGCLPLRSEMNYGNIWLRMMLK